MNEMSLKVYPHPRCHIAPCNGSLDLLKAKVDRYPNGQCLSAAERAALVDEWTDKETERKALRLAQFQREVKLRVSAREKLIQQEMVETSSKAMQAEQAAAERALKLDDTKVRQCVVKGHDVEDVKVMASGRDSHFSQFKGPSESSALQAARNTLLSQSYNHQKYSSGEKGNTKTGNLASMVERLHTSYKNAQELSSDNCMRRLTMDTTDTDRNAESPKRIARKFTAPGQIEHMEKVQARKQYLLFRRLYSDLEREQVRKKKLQSSHSHQVEAMKGRKEKERRKVEDEVTSVHSSSVISTSISQDKRMAEEWAELMLLEERKQQLQKAKEMERYVTALKVRLREQVEIRKLVVPPLCSCAKTIWDTNPKNCANNCIFYKNTKAYVKALSNLLQSLNI